MKINKDWRYKRQECFDITKRPLIPFTFDEDRLVYENVNLSIFTTPICNAKCDFCVAELRYLNTGLDFLKPTIKDDEEYFTRLEAVIKRIRPINPSVSLTGGEPSLCPRLTRIVELLNHYDIRKRTITTNGTGLLIKQNGKYPLDLLIENKFQHLNISHAHYDYDKNIALMKYSKTELPHELLKEIVSISNPAGLRARLSCVLIKEGVNGVPEMKKYMKFAESIGVDNVVFRELMKYDTSRIKAGRILDFCERNRVDLNKVWEEIDNDPDFTFINQVLGYYYYVEVYKYHNIDMVSESADLKNIAKEKAKANTELPVVYEMVFHPNGTLNGSWREWEDILLK